MDDKPEASHTLPADTDEAKFLFIIILLAVTISGGVIWYIEINSLSGIWKPIQSGLINILTAMVGLGAASLLLRNYNNRAQRRLIDEGLSNRFMTLQSKLNDVEQRVSSEIALTRKVVLSTANCLQQSFLLKDTPYTELFSNATEVGLLVQGWDRWIEERRRDIVQLVKRDGSFTLVVHNPNNENVVAAMSSRWVLRKMDQKTEINNTVALLKSIVQDKKISILQRNGVIWYCAIRFAYQRPDDIVYIISPYAHQDYPVADIPAFLIRKSLSPELVEFFEYEWERLLTR